MDLGFIADIVENWNNLNLEFEGKNKDIGILIESVNSILIEIGFVDNHLPKYENNYWQC